MSRLKVALIVAGVWLSPFAAAAQDLLIASSLPLTGGSAWYGGQGKNGAELAVAEVNAAGGVLGRKVAIDFIDNRCNPAEGVRGMTQALARSATAIHDGGCSTVALAIMPLAERASVPYMVASPSATAISERSGVGGNKWAFKIIPTDAGMLSALVQWIVDKGQAGKVAFVGEDTDYGRGRRESFDAALAKHGQKLISHDFYAQGTPDYTTLISRVKAAKPSLLAAYTIGADGLNFLRQWTEAGGGVALTGRIFTDNIPKEIMASGVLQRLTTIHPYDIHRDDPINKDFVARYEKRFGSSPNLTSWASYEAVQVIVDAAKAAGSVEGGPVRDALAAGEFKTMFGDTIKFDDHNLAHLDALILSIEGAQVKVVGRSKT